jgi:phytoene desaturase
MKTKHVVVIGAGPGGLTSAMILARKGYRVTLCEKKMEVGGRNGAIRLGEYVFDIGPTFLMMDFLLRQAFEDAGRQAQDYLQLSRLEPMYQLSFAHQQVQVSSDKAAMRDAIERAWPGNGAGFERFITQEKRRYERMYPCLQVPYSSALSMVSPNLMRAIPHLSLGRSLYQNLARYFSAEDLRIAFTFQSKYLGMSPWNCPAAFTIIPFIEHSFGIYHTRGGLSSISEAMARVFGEHGGELRLGHAVRRVVVKGGKARGVELVNGEQLDADAVVINADFGHAMQTLFEPGIIHKWAPHKLRKKVYSCSTFMLYLGLDKIYDEPHHNIVFSNDYRTFINSVAGGGALCDDMSIYVRNASVLDPTLAPSSHSALYVLVPVPNATSGIEWTEELTQRYRDKILSTIEQRTSMRDLRQHIVTHHTITPRQWVQDYDLFLGATFNLGHTIPQMLYFRPHNRFEEVGNCYLVGGGTHPGSGLPTIYESGRISAHLIQKEIR